MSTGESDPEIQKEYDQRLNIITRLRHTIGRLLLMMPVATGGITAAESVSHSSSAAYAEMETGGYPDWNRPCVTKSDPNYGETNGSDFWCDGYNWGDLETGDMTSPRGYAYRNCTDWAAFRANQLTGENVPWGWGHAKNWDDKAATAYEVDSTPEVGDIAVWDSGDYGHAAVVESVNSDGSINISEYNQHRDGNYGRRTLNPNDPDRFPDQFIDLNGDGPVMVSPVNAPANAWAEDVFYATGSSTTGWSYSPQGIYGLKPLRNVGAAANSLLIGDFDQDGHEDDVLLADGGAYGWQLSRNATDGWKQMKPTKATKASLKIGDFDQDGFNDDVFYASGNKIDGWMYSKDGTGDWMPLKKSSATANNLIVGDFDQDGFEDDVIVADGGDYGWLLSVNGSNPWENTKASRVTGKDLMVGDFDQDGFRDDVMHPSGTKETGWIYAKDGRGKWLTLRNVGARSESLLVGDFDRDGFEDDILLADGGSYGWQVSIDARNGWEQRRMSGVTAQSLLVGDFGDGNPAL